MPGTPAVTRVLKFMPAPSGKEKRKMENQIKAMLNKIGAAENALDRLSDAAGRAKCGYIWVLSTVLEDLKADLRNLTDPQAAEKEEDAEAIQNEAPAAE